MINTTRQFIGYGILAIGTIFYVLKIQIPRKVLMSLFFVLNVILQMPDMFLLHQNFGIDFKAYIN